jgi:hypothetical protein
MSNEKAIQGTYSDFKIIKSRSVAQIIVEVPLEKAEEIVDIFGLPQPEQELWVGVIALNKKAIINNKEATQAIQMAGMLCRNENFGIWLRENRGMKDINPTKHEDIANGLRAILGIKSRTEFQNNPELIYAFNNLKSEYDQFLANS